MITVSNLSTPRKIWMLLTPAERRSCIILFGFMVIGMILETLSVGLVIPAIALINQNNYLATYSTFQSLLVVFGNPSREMLAIAGMLLFVALYIIKNLYLAYLVWRGACFAFELRANISQRLFTGYIRQPYTFHLQRNSAQLIHNVTGEVNMFTGATQSALIILTEALVFLGITILLLCIEPLGALLVVTTLGLAGLGFYRFTRGLILRWGQERRFHEGLRIQHLQQGLGGAKDVKLLGREDDFLAQYQLHNTGSARVGQFQYTLQALPRLWLELLAVLGLVTLMLVMIGQNKSLETLLPMLGLFAAAAFRIMPSVNRVISAFQGLRYALPVINNLYDELKLIDCSSEYQLGPLLPFCNILKLNQVSFTYPMTVTPALSEVNLSIPRGATIGFVGTTGAGKSTLVDIILGLFTPGSGTVEVDGINIQSNLRGWQDQIGYVPQSIFLTDDTLRRNIAFGLPNEQIDESAVWRALHAAQLESFVNELALGLDTIIGERGIRLSGGQRQRIGIARALYHNPQVLVLDEATSSLDTETEFGVMEVVRTLHGNKTILIVAHRLSTVQDCDRLYRLEHGKIVDEGTPATMLLVKKIAKST